MSDSTDNSVRIVFTGDVALGGEFLERARPRNAPLTFPFTTINDTLSDADVVVVNLEGPIGTEGRPRPGRSALLFNDPAVLDWLAGFRCSVCCLANNHMMDYGPEALARTQRLLSERGIHHVGAGMNAEQAGKELRLTIRGLKLAILAFTTDEVHVGSVLAGASEPGSCGLPDEKILCDRVSRLAAETDAVIVLLHWGYEYFHYPAPVQVDLCRKLADAGARVVVGHHPHVQQGCETRGTSLIAYSLGNLLLPEMRSASGRLQYRKPVTRQYALLNTTILQGRLGEWQLSGGAWDSHYNLLPFREASAEQFTTRMSEMSEPFKLSNYGLFWDNYATRRRAELKSEEFRDALAKIGKTDFRTLLRTFSVRDLRRNFRRLAKLATGRKTEASLADSAIKHTSAS